MTSRELADILSEIETLLVLHGENEFKATAYSRASRALSSTQIDIATAIEQGQLGTIAGIGKSISGEITQIFIAGESEQLNNLLQITPVGLLDVLKIRGLGAKKVRTLWNELGITSLGELEYACNENRISALKGFGQKSQEKILSNLQDVKNNLGKLRLDEATVLSELILEKFSQIPEITNATTAGAVRRGTEETDCLRFVIETAFPQEVIKKISELEEVSNFIHRLEKDSYRLAFNFSDVKTKIRVANKGQFYAMLHSYTGASDYYFMLSIALKNEGYDLRDDGIYKDEEPVLVSSEQEIFSLAKMQFIPPELREGIEEVRYAIDGKIPELVDKTDISGMFHVHSNWSDGENSLEELAEFCVKNNWKYLLVCDHSKSAFYANGLNEKRLYEQGEAIDEINKRYDPDQFRMLKGTECDILADGKLDFDDDTLASLDAVVGSIHSNFNLDKEAQTNRLCMALQNKHVTMLGHPTGRLILSRKGYEIDFQKVITTAAEFGKSIELNASPYRLDLNWRMIKFAKRKGVKIAINTDAHSIRGFGAMRYGLVIARKGWLGKNDILNSMTCDEFLKFAKR